MSLTAPAVSNASPTEKPYKLADGGGMYLEVMPNGSKYWRLKYRFAGKEKRLALGVYPKMSLADARKEREKAKDFLKDGKDPSEEMSKKALKAANMTNAENSLESVAREWFGKRTHIWVPSHTADVKRRLEVNVFPDLGRRPIAEIEAPDLLATVRKIEERGSTILRTASCLCAGRCSATASLPGAANATYLQTCAVR